MGQFGREQRGIRFGKWAPMTGIDMGSNHLGYPIKGA